MNIKSDIDKTVKFLNRLQVKREIRLIMMK